MPAIRVSSSQLSASQSQHVLCFVCQSVIPADDSQLLLRVLEDALSKLDLLENMQSLQD